MSAQASFINSMLDTALTGTFTLKLFRTSLPSTGGVEVSGGSYAGIALTFAAASAKVKSASSVTFTNMPTGQTVVAYGLYNGATLVDEGALASPYTADLTNNSFTTTYSFSLAGA